ncbi:MAG: 50S ribosomal protein L22 [Nanoarchaeota archaeon]|nr:50S ribosomal protein L22 [Nanoarchaeota archaeon]
MEQRAEAKVSGSNLPVSTKHSVAIASFIRGKQVNKALALLEQVTIEKVAVPYKRFNRDVGHRPGHVGPGRYPFKASKAVIMLLKSLVANAQQKGLDINNLYIQHMTANVGARPFRYGRHRRIKAKQTNIDIVAVQRKETRTKPVKVQAVKEAKKQ